MKIDILGMDLILSYITGMYKVHLEKIVSISLIILSTFKGKNREEIASHLVISSYKTFSIAKLTLKGQIGCKLGFKLEFHECYHFAI